MKMIRPLARGGEWFQNYLRQQRAKLESDFALQGGMFTYHAPSGPVDGATYDDPHKPPEYNEMNKDLEGWEPLL